MKELQRLTLICIDTKNHGQAVFSLRKSLEQIKPARAIFFTDIDVQNVGEGIEVIQIEKLHSKQDYSKFIVKELYKYLDTDFVLVTQWDAWVLNGDSWNDTFYSYDYIGAPWLYVDGKNIGNGGFSLRSKKLQTILAKDKFIQITDPEDEITGRLYRRYLEKIGIKFPSEDLADHFSFELRTPVYNTFGFHGFFHKPYQKTVVIKRSGALGDCIMVEPVLHYFYKKNYRVVLDAPPSVINYFIQHYFKVHRMDEVDGRVFKDAEFYNLDSCYESSPKELHLKLYYDFCGVPEDERVYRNPKLFLSYDYKKDAKIFPKYAILHCDKRNEPHRNTRVDWSIIVEILRQKWYHVFQLGAGEHEEIEGTIQMKTPAEPFLMWVVASSDLFIGEDSGVSHIASGFDIPSIIFSGSVDLRIIHPDLSNKLWFHNHDKKVCGTPFCWHNNVGYSGKDCIVNVKNPPCMEFDIEEIIPKINDFLKKLEI